MLINIKTGFLPICTFGSFTEKESEGRLHGKYFWHFFERRMLPLAQIEMVQLFPIQQFSFSENRRQDVTIAHVGAYRSYFHLGLAACLEDLGSKSPLLRMALLDFTPSPLGARENTKHTFLHQQIFIFSPLRSIPFQVCHCTATHYGSSN